MLYSFDNQSFSRTIVTIILQQPSQSFCKSQPWPQYHFQNNSNNHFLYNHNFSENYSSFHSINGSVWSSAQRRYLKRAAIIFGILIICSLLEIHIKHLKSILLWSLIIEWHSVSLALSSMRDCLVLSLGRLSSPPFTVDSPDLFNALWFHFCLMI